MKRIKFLITLSFFSISTLPSVFGMDQENPHARSSQYLNFSEYPCDFTDFYSISNVKEGGAFCIDNHFDSDGKQYLIASENELLYSVAKEPVWGVEGIIPSYLNEEQKVPISALGLDFKELEKFLKTKGLEIKTIHLLEYESRKPCPVFKEDFKKLGITEEKIEYVLLKKGFEGVALGPKHGLLYLTK